MQTHSVYDGMKVRDGSVSRQHSVSVCVFVCAHRHMHAGMCQVGALGQQSHNNGTNNKMK